MEKILLESLKEKIELKWIFIIGLKINQMNLIKFLFIVVLLSCKNPKLGFDTHKKYDLNNPSNVWELPKKLNEISGISVLNFPIILCVNDEEGKLYEYNLETRSVVNIYKFGKKGDYEDLAVKGDSIYVLKSNGTIYQINNLKNIEEVGTHKTFLSQKQNTEGLFFDKERNRLLIACKNTIEINNKPKNVIYEFDLDSNTMNTIPTYIIPKQEYKNQRKSHHFAPSCLAIHPKTKTLFIISSIGKMMIEMSLEGKILNQYSLNHPYFTQPEGVFFTKNGDLYISNETKNNIKATVIKFNYLK
jgi:hypothetical protein